MKSNITLVEVWSRELPSVPCHTFWPFLLDGRVVVPVEDMVHGGVNLYDPQRPDPVATLPGPCQESWVVCPVPVEDGRVLVAAGRHDGHVTVWDVGSRVEVGAFDTGGLGTGCVVPTVDGHRLVVDGIDGVDLYDVRSGNKTGFIHLGDSWGVGLMCAVRSYGRDLLVTANGDEEVTRTWDIVKREQWAWLDGHDGAVLHIRAVSLSDDPLGDQLLATAVTGGPLTLWDPTTGEVMIGDLEHDGEAYGLFTARIGGRHLLGAHDDEQVLRLWDPRTGEQVCQQKMPYIVQDAVQGGEHLLVQHPDGLAGWRIQVEEA